MLLWTIITFAANSYCLQIENNSSHTQEEITTLFPVNQTISDIIQTKNQKNDSILTQMTIKTDATTWKLDTAYAASNLTEGNIANCTESREDEKFEKEKPNFRPSVPLGSIEEESGHSTESSGSFTPVVKNLPTVFKSSPKQQYYKAPSNELFKNLNYFPYKFESPTVTKAKINWKSPNLESTPTEEVPIKIPAGELYQISTKIPAGELYQVPAKIPAGGLYHLPLKNKPNYGFGFNIFNKDEVKESHFEKRTNPWQSVMHLMTALIPVGLIASALSPQIITIGESTPNAMPKWNLYRRADVAAADKPAPISERCRRRLLCELRSEKLYQMYAKEDGAGPKCYRLYCENPEGLAAVMKFLLTYHKHKI